MEVRTLKAVYDVQLWDAVIRSMRSTGLRMGIEILHTTLDSSYPALLPPRNLAL